MSWGPQTNPNGTALTGRKSTLPPLRDLLTDLLNGMTAEEMAETYGCSVGRIKAVLNQGGYSSTTGQPLQPAVAELARLVAAVVPGPWVDDALCAQVDTEMFFPEKGGSTREAKSICARCPVAADCLDYALAFPNSHDYDIYGGTSPKERRRLRKALEADTHAHQEAS